MPESTLPSLNTESCMRCGRAFDLSPGSDQGQWIEKWRSGVLEGVICPGCQTPEQSLRAQVDSIEDEGSERVVVDLSTLDGETRAKLMIEAAWASAKRIVLEMGERADMLKAAGEEPMILTEELVDEWAERAIRETPMLDGASGNAREALFEEAKAQICGMFGIEWTPSHDREDDED